MLKKDSLASPAVADALSKMSPKDPRRTHLLAADLKGKTTEADNLIKLLKQVVEKE